MLSVPSIYLLGSLPAQVNYLIFWVQEFVEIITEGVFHACEGFEKLLNVKAILCHEPNSFTEFSSLQNDWLAIPTSYTHARPPCRLSVCVAVTVRKSSQRI